MHRFIFVKQLFIRKDNETNKFPFLLEAKYSSLTATNDVPLYFYANS